MEEMYVSWNQRQLLRSIDRQIDAAAAPYIGRSRVAAIRRLAARGYVVQNGRQWQITEKAREALNRLDPR